MRLADIHFKFDTDKGTNHSYIELYDRLFAQFQNEPVNILEIGVLTGGSLKMFHKYFSSATIYGVDLWLYPSSTDWFPHGFRTLGNVDDVLKDIDDNYPRIRLITCDSTSHEDVQKNLSGLTFKAIIDDGDHALESQFATFRNCISLLADGGVYIVEDVETFDELEQLINQYASRHFLRLTSEVFCYFKGGRVDDVLVVCRKTK